MEATIKQINYLKKLGASESELIDLDIAKASKLIKSYLKNKNGVKTTYHQNNNNYSDLMNELIKNQDELKTELVKKIGNTDEWYLKNISFIAKIDGNLVVFYKKDIETRFCYGYGYCGVTTKEDIERAYNMADATRQREEIFLNDNLEYYNSFIKDIKEQKESNGNWDYGYSKNYKYDFYTLNVVRDGYGRLDNNFIEINNYDLLLEILEYEKAKFEKRLHTYLKRYGLSKLKVWAYLVD